MKAIPTWPLAVVELVMEGAGGAFIVIAKAVDPVPPALVALIVALVLPVTVVVPEITPLLVLTVSPVGRPVAL